MLDDHTQPAIDRIPADDLPRFIRNYERKLRPVILANATRDWPARQKWTLDYFQNELGALRVTIKGSEYIKGSGHQNGQSCSMAELIAQVEASSEAAPGPYLWEANVEEALPEGHLADILPLPGIGPGWMDSPLLRESALRAKGIPELLIAGAGTSFPFLHFDVNHDNACITQIMGDKIFWLYPPEQTPYMYPKPGVAESHLSQIGNIEKVDLERFPLFAKARPMKAVLGPGDAIFLPAGWWHCTRVLSTSIAIRNSSVSRSNWAVFCADKLAYTREHEPVRTAAKALYYWMLGGVLRCRDLIHSPLGRENIQ